MNKTALKALLCSFYPSSYQDFYRFLPQETVEDLNSLEEPLLDLKRLFSEKRWMEKIHYSWFLPFLETLPPESLPFFLYLFPKDEKKELQALLHVEQEKKPSFPLFLLSTMYKQIYPSEMLPRELFKKTDMDRLFKLSKKELILLVDLLGMYDLAVEMRQIVDKTLLQKIHGALSRDQHAFLQFASKQSIKWTPPKLNLTGWDKDAKKLRNLLHYRGLFRLAMATYEEEENFKWHLCHQFDIGRGKVLLKFYAGKSDREMIPYFRAQTLDIINRFER